MRITAANDAPVSSRGAYVLYWMIAARRTRSSFALDHATWRACELRKPLLVLEPLRAGYKWASDRLHTFVLQGMADNARAFADAGITYLPYVEPSAGDGRGLLAALAERASLVVTDEQPGFFLPRMVAAAAEHLPVRVELVDGNGLLPLRAMERDYPSAAAFRRRLQKLLPVHFGLPAAEPLADLPRVVRGAPLDDAILARWPAATPALLAADPAALARLDIDHSVGPVATRGGAVAAAATYDDFLGRKLDRYADRRSHPDDDAASGLSPYLHFGHISVHDIARRLFDTLDWDPSHLATAKVTGTRDGYWGLPPSAESFLDELVTWRELGYGFCFHRPDYDRYSSLPTWAKQTLDTHARDPRIQLHSLADLEAARSIDPVWNAAQRQLITEGRIHNYLRMLWGKLVLAWSPTPKKALATLIELNNKYAIDGRDPNSYSGIFWTLGRFDRPWPERPVFGTVRYMSSASTLKKLRLKEYLARYA